MSRDASITLAWRDGEDRFRLGINEMRALQEKCNAGLGTIQKRLVSGDWFVDDYRETIRLALIGAGSSSDEAMKKIRRSVDDHPQAESILLAVAIISAVYAGFEIEPVGKAAAEEAKTEATVASPFPPSTVPV